MFSIDGQRRLGAGKVKRVKGGYAVVHCHGAKKGRRIGTHRTKAKAMAQHRAIQASKRRRGKR